MTPSSIKALIAEKLSARRKNDKGKLVKISKELGEWFMLHLRYQDAINEYLDLVTFLKVKLFKLVPYSRQGIYKGSLI